MYEIVPQTELIAKRLRQAKVDEVITHEELTGIAGCDVRTGKGYARLRSALNMVLNDRQFGHAFKAVRGVGIQRMKPEEASGVGETAIKRSYKSAGRAIKKIQAMIGTSELTDADRIKVLGSMSILGALRQTSAPKMLDRAREKIANNGVAALPLEETLKLFGRKNGST